MTIKDTILDLLKLKKSNSPYLSRIYNFNKLIKSLQELDQLVEMEDAKETVCKQIKYLIVEHDSSDNSMLNALITGDPGVGKTKLASILAKIWNAMGLIKRKKTTDLTKEIPILVSNHLYETHISDLKSKITELQKVCNVIKDKNPEIIKNIENVDNNLERLRIKNRFINYKHEESTLEAVEEIKNYQKYLSEIIKPHLEEIPQINIEEARSQSHIDTEQDDLMVVTREDFVAGFCGQTAIKTKNLLEKARGKVLFIDEAYSLYNGSETSNDSFGMEALTILNEFMSRYPDEIIIIFAGYKHLMDQTIFKRQPGLKRRCMWVFDIKSYTPQGLSRIFVYQLNNNKWYLQDDPIEQKENIYETKSDIPITQPIENEPDHNIVTVLQRDKLIPTVPIVKLEQIPSMTEDELEIISNDSSLVLLAPENKPSNYKDPVENVNIVEFFETNSDSFPEYGGDTQKLAYHCKLAYSQIKYELLINNEEVEFDHIINKSMLNTAFDKYKEHQKQDNNKSNVNWQNMYR